jgi:putative PIN family toxin of toxin-antitoxin system
VWVVLDTNVLVSGLLGLYTYPARLIDMVYIGRLQCVYDDRIMTEYRDVLSRPRFTQVISDKERKDLLGYLAHSGRHVVAGPLGKSTISAQDPDDVPFVEVAVAGSAKHIVTGNASHFSFFYSNQWGITVLSPRECYELMCSE